MNALHNTTAIHLRANSRKLQFLGIGYKSTDCEQLAIVYQQQEFDIRNSVQVGSISVIGVYGQTFFTESNIRIGHTSERWFQIPFQRTLLVHLIRLLR